MERLKDFVLSLSPIHRGPEVKNVVELRSVRDVTLSVLLQLHQRACDPGRLEHSIFDENVFPWNFETIEGLEEMLVRVREGDLEINRDCVIS